MSVNKAEVKERRTDSVGKSVSNGHKGRSQKCCFGYKLNKSGKEASK